MLAFATLGAAGVRLWLTLGAQLALLGTVRGEAHTDELTEPGNRRLLMSDLARRSTGPRPSVRCC